MGKKTDKFIADIQDLVAACEEPLSAFSTTCNSMSRVSHRLAELTELDSARRRELSGAANDGRQGQEGVTNQSEELEQLYESDPQLRTYDAEFDRLNPQFLNLIQQKAAQKTALQRAVKEFKDKLDEFSTYVTKKDKSLNPFRGKKSVKSAKAFIGSMEELLDGMIALARG